MGLLSNEDKSIFDIVIVDNNSTDVDNIEHDFILRNEDNLWFAWWVNRVINDINFLEKYDSFLLMNPDITWYSSNFFLNLLKWREMYDICWCTVLYAGWKFIQSAWWKINYSNWHTILINKGLEYKNYWPKKDSIDFVSWCCMMISTHLIKNIWWLPEEYFLYFEESDYCRIAKNKWFSVGLLDSNTYVIHDTSSTIWYLSKTYLYYMVRNQKIFSLKIVRRYMVPYFRVRYILYFIAWYSYLSVKKWEIKNLKTIFQWALGLNLIN